MILERQSPVGSRAQQRQSLECRAEATCDRSFSQPDDHRRVPTRSWTTTRMAPFPVSCLVHFHVLNIIPEGFKPYTPRTVLRHNVWCFETVLVR
jgi:hypothetical protein